MASYWQIVTSLSFFPYMANLEISGDWIPDAWSVKLTFSSRVIFYLTKTEIELKNLEHTPHAIALSKGTISDAKKC